MKRADGRPIKALRPVKITRNYLKHPEGSVLIEMGETKVICAASVANGVPPHKKGSGSGWVTAEYDMLPRATTERNNRNRTKGRTFEIQRLIGRALRAIIDLNKLGERSITIDCDVIQADGGTRTAAITGAWVALRDAVNKLLRDGKIDQDPIKQHLAAVSVGIVDDQPLLDLDYSEDFRAEVDMNVVMTEDGNLVEVQGTAEGRSFTTEELLELIKLAHKGIKELIGKQK